MKAYIHQGFLDYLLKQDAKKYQGLVSQVQEEGAPSAEGYQMDREDWEDLQVDYGLKECRGVGDVVAKVIKRVTGIKPCTSCTERRRKWNKK